MTVSFGVSEPSFPAALAAAGDPAAGRRVPPAVRSRARAATRPRAERLEGRALLTAANPADPAVLRIDAGGGAFTDHLGHVWAADSAAGGAAGSTPAGVGGTPDPDLFSTFRTGDFSYQLPAPAGSYALQLLFAEPTDLPGQRVFNVTAYGRPLLTRLDVAGTVGAHYFMSETFPVTVADGALDLNFTSVYGGALLSALALYPAAPAPAPGDGGPLTVLPLGDSITYGSAPGADPTGGYRSRLYQDFAAAGGAVRYVGSVYDTGSTLLENAGQAWFEGHGGYNLSEIARNFDGVGPATAASPNDGGHWIDGTGPRGPLYPDAVLLEAGTNDILKGHPGAQVAADMDALIDKITTDRPGAELFVATLTPVGDPTENAQVRAFNDLLRGTVVPKYQRFGRHVALVDQYANFIDAGGDVLTSQLSSDGVHPTGPGYDRMGDTWYAAIRQWAAGTTPTSTGTTPSPTGTTPPPVAPTPAPAALPQGTLGLIVAARLPASVVAGTRAAARVSLTLGNPTAGALAGPATVTVYASPSPSLSGATVLAVESRPLDLKPGRAKKLDLKLPSFASALPAGDWFLVATIRGPDGTTMGAAGPSFTVSPARVAAALSDLRAVRATAPGKPAEVEITVTDTGNVPISARAVLAVSASPQAGGGASLSLGQVPLRLRLRPGSARSYRVKVVVPASVPTGGYALTASLALGPPDAPAAATSATPLTIL